jgi:hypothetical protein
MEQQTNPVPADNPATGEQPQQKIAENPNPRANENIKQTPFEEKGEGKPGDDVGTEITDGEAG